MPHLTIDYSANLTGDVDLSALCEVLRATAAEIDTFPTAGIRVRAFRADHYAIADGNPNHGYIDVSVRLREGRAQEVKEHASQRLFAAMEAHLAPVLARRSLSLSLEMRDISATLAPKTGTTRDYMKG